MTVTGFRQAMGALLGTRSPIFLTVSPDWDTLDHLGVVSARVFPGSSTLCPYLYQDSVVRVGLSSCSDDGLEGSFGAFSPADASSKRPRDCDLPRSPPDLGVLPDDCFRVTSSEKRQLLAEFRKEARRARSQFRETLVMEWHQTYPSMGDKENYSGPTGLSDSGFYNDEFAFDHFVSVRMDSYDRWAEERKTTFLSSLKSRPPTPPSGQAGRFEQLRQERTQALWAGLWRQFFSDTEVGPVLTDAPGTRGEEDDDTRVSLLREEISALMEQLQRRQTRFPTNPPSPPPGPNEFDPDDPPPDQTLALCQQPPSDESSSPPISPEGISGAPSIKPHQANTSEGPCFCSKES